MQKLLINKPTDDVPNGDSIPEDEYSEDSDVSDEDFYEWDESMYNCISIMSQLVTCLLLLGYRLQAKGTGLNPNQQTSSSKVVSFQPQEKLFKKFSHKITVDEFKMPSSNDEDKLRIKDKQDRATAEQVMDPRTRMILFKLMNRGFITQINGCISTGKEANVYHATGKDGNHLALKIYKTSILVFKDRDKYVTGEFR